MANEVPKYITKVHESENIPNFKCINCARTSTDRVFLWCDDVVSFEDILYKPITEAEGNNMMDSRGVILSIINEYLHIIFSFLYENLPSRKDNSSVGSILKSIVDPSNEPYTETHCHNMYSDIMLILFVVLESVHSKPEDCSAEFNEAKDSVKDYWNRNILSKHMGSSGTKVIFTKFVNNKHLRNILERHAPRWHNTCEVSFALNSTRSKKETYTKLMHSCLSHDPYAILFFAGLYQRRFIETKYENGFDTITWKSNAADEIDSEDAVDEIGSEDEDDETGSENEAEELDPEAAAGKAGSENSIDPEELSSPQPGMNKAGESEHAESAIHELDADSHFDIDSFLNELSD